MQELKELVGLINKGLPGAWEAAIRQMYINGSLLIIGAVISGVTSALMYIHL